jgi:hypothetical protein
VESGKVGSLLKNKVVSSDPIRETWEFTEQDLSKRMNQIPKDMMKEMTIKHLNIPKVFQMIWRANIFSEWRVSHNLLKKTR